MIKVDKGNKSSNNKIVKNLLGNKNLILKLLGILLILVILVTGGLVINRLRVSNSSDFVLKKTMEFDSAEDIPKNMKEIQKYLTPELYANYGLNSENFTYYNFFKMKNSKSEINIVKSNKNVKGGYIIYSINNEYIAKSRRFIMVYNVGWFKFTSINYYEIVGEM